MSQTPQPFPADELELLAPAGNFDALQAALDAGADAVYLGLTSLNARRRARNFSQDEFVRAVAAARVRSAKVYLTLNIDLAQRELGQAARMLQLASEAGADAVLVRDPALLMLKRFYPRLEFHFSTQTCMTSSADVQAARELGAKRVVLARELTLAEIAAASAVPDIQTEVFVQGALCFCISGRCLLSSWVGGHSGNRGACTSPCRVPWSVNGAPAGTPLSMRDLSTAHRIDDLRLAGVAALKIEGRLKNAGWVKDAVSLYRCALAGEDPEQLASDAGSLGSYTGRQLTCGYLDGQRDDLTATAAGRSQTPSPLRERAGERVESPEDQTPESREDAEDTYDFSLTVAEKSLACRLTCNGQSLDWTMPKTVVHRAHKAISINQLVDSLSSLTLHECRLNKAATNDPSFLLVPRAANALVDRIASSIRQAMKQNADDLIRIELAGPVREFLADAAASSAASPNTLALGDPPDRVRLETNHVGAFLRRIRASGSLEFRPSAIVVENATAGSLPKLLSLAPDIPIIVALPGVFFEEEIPAIRNLLLQCARLSARVEVNNWAGWRLARETGLPMEAGPGMGVLNSLAARALAEHGMEGATLSIEADHRQLEEATKSCDAPLSLIVFGRPALMTTRARPPQEYMSHIFRDRRNVKMVPRLERNLWTFRPPDPFDLRGLRNPRIRVAHLVVDLVASPEPADEWLSGPDPDTKPFRFNYGRTLE